MNIKINKEDELKLLIYDILDFKENINSNTVSKFIERFTEEFKYNFTIKLMTITKEKISFSEFNLLVYSFNLLVSVIKFRDDIDVTYDIDLNGLHIDDYIKGNIFKPTKEYGKGFKSLSDEIGIDYNNKLTVKEKILLLENEIKKNTNYNTEFDSLEKLKEKKYKPKNKYKKPEVYTFRITGKNATIHKDFVNRTKDLNPTDKEIEWNKYILTDEYITNKNKPYDWLKKK